VKSKVVGSDVKVRDEDLGDDYARDVLVVAGISLTEADVVLAHPLTAGGGDSFQLEVEDDGAGTDHVTLWPSFDYGSARALTLQ